MSRFGFQTDLEAREIILQGQVQGVGFRPFIYRLARQHGLSGFVRNCTGEVLIHVQGKTRDIEAFVADILLHKPPLARPELKRDCTVDPLELTSFHIEHSVADGLANISLPVDVALCDDCLQEMNNPADRRYRYPFINCTQCGPRYTLIRNLPYDRRNTTMHAFPLCERCSKEYEDPADRRFHAEPVACPVCGPRLQYRPAAAGGTAVSGNEPALSTALAALRCGQVIAVKGIGGYHLMCDASDQHAVERLRARKPRPHKPLAVMLPMPVLDADGLQPYVALQDDEREFLSLPTRPLLLVEKVKSSKLAANVAPGLDEVGVMFPYSPLHHLLLSGFGGPLVATSANISGDPVLTDNAEAEQRLAAIADGFLHHDRPIERPADDPVYRTIAGRPRPLRTGRGIAPLELTLPFRLERPVLAVGTHMKNTITLAWDDRAILSPHIGEMGNLRSQHVFEQTIEDMQRLYSARAEVLICDAHPGYAPSRWATRQDLPVHQVWHHHAHASAALYGMTGNSEVIAFTWDGVGYGEDGSLWGGEAFVGRPGRWRRVATMRQFELPGGERAGREAWRSAAALCWHCGRQWQMPDATDADTGLLKQAWLNKLNCPATSAVGRLFDAAASLIGIRHSYSFEGQGPMELETLAGREISTGRVAGTATMADIIQQAVSCDHLSDADLVTSDWEALIDMMMDDSLSKQYRAWCFHASMAFLLVEQADMIRRREGLSRVTLSGGVFQNRVLTELVLCLLREQGFRVLVPDMIPVNDAGISFGQIMDYGYSKYRG